jgi:hypothetical protein
MLSGDISFTEALSSLNVGYPDNLFSNSSSDLLKDYDDKTLLGDIDISRRLSRIVNFNPAVGVGKTTMATTSGAAFRISQKKLILATDY